MSAFLLAIMSHIFHFPWVFRFFSTKAQSSLSLPWDFDNFQIPWVFQVFHVFQICGHPVSESSPDQAGSIRLRRTLCDLLSPVGLQFWKGIHCTGNIISVWLRPCIRPALSFYMASLNAAVPFCYDRSHWSGRFQEWCVTGRLRLEYMK